VSSKLQHALEELYGLERRKDKLGLDGTRELLAALGNPERRFRSVHVAGTNGKGSVCAIIERVLREAGHRTGLFTSPHLVDFRERIRVNGRWADEAWLEQALARIQALPEGQNRTFFEVVTALGFLYFAEQGVEWAVVEVGLGGRLDTTNVLVPEVCAITSIGMDHTEILGDTIEQIAAEKAGIAKPGVPLVLAELEPAARNAIERVATTVDAPIPPFLGRFVFGPIRDIVLENGSFHDTRWGSIPYTPDSLVYRFPGNALVAVHALSVLCESGVAIPASAITKGLAAARWPGRFEPCPTRSRLWWDGAHNLPAFRELLVNVFLHRVRPDLVLAFARDKDAEAILDLLREHLPEVRLFMTRTRSERARDPDELAALARARGFEVATAPDVPMAVERALGPDRQGGFVLLTGSLFAVGEAMEAFGGAPGEQL
jgi:dihydrofolate synthase / folylpolyglutamate synthase